jgi:hypothetical protein
MLDIRAGVRRRANGARQGKLIGLIKLIELIGLVDRNGFLQSEIHIPQSAIERLDAGYSMLVEEFIELIMLIG